MDEKFFFEKITNFNFDFYFLDEKKCNYALWDLLHDKNIMCPGCKKSPFLGDTVAKNERKERKYINGERIQCYSCKKKFTYRTDTPLSGIHLNSKQVVFLLVFFDFYKPAEMAVKLGCDVTTVRKLRKKFFYVDDGGRG